MMQQPFPVLIPKIQALLRPYFGRIANISDREKRSLEKFLKLDPGQFIPIHFTRNELTFEIGGDLNLLHWRLAEDPTSEQEAEIIKLRDSIYFEVLGSVFKDVNILTTKTDSVEIRADKIWVKMTGYGFGDSSAELYSALASLKRGDLTKANLKDLLIVKRTEQSESEDLNDITKETGRWSFWATACLECEDAS